MIIGKTVNGKKVLSTGDELFLPQNPKRRYLSITNDSLDTIWIQLGGGHGARGEGIRLNAQGGSFEMTLFTLYRGAIWAGSELAVAATSDVSYVEGE